MSQVNQRAQELENSYKAMQIVKEFEKMTFDFSDEWWQNFCDHCKGTGTTNYLTKNGNLICMCTFVTRHGNLSRGYGFLSQNEANDLHKVKSIVKILKERSNMTDYTWVKQLTKAIKDAHAYEKRYY